MEGHMTDNSISMIMSKRTSAGAPEAAIVHNDQQYLQRSMIVGARTPWQVPQVLKYKNHDVETTPSAAKLHALAVKRIERHWHKDVATECLPLELERTTPYSLALLTRLDALANHTRDDHERGVSLLREAFEQRRSQEAAYGGDTLLDIVTTRPDLVGKQRRSKVVEDEIWENRTGIMLKDVDRATRSAVKVATKARYAKAPGETKATMQARVKKERRKTAKELAATARRVVALRLKKDEEFKEIEHRLGHKLLRNQRKDVTKIRKAQFNSAGKGITYSMAASGPYGDIVTVKGLGSSVGRDTDAERPGLSEEGRRFLEDNNIKTDDAEARGHQASTFSTANAVNLERMADREPAGLKASGSGFRARHDGLSLVAAMREASISTLAGAELEESKDKSSG
ncbi:hypothetical protein Slin15195_G072680 [Septoria linicola]|uniref:Uncharacterized protein n=1 Tax=Septoria linicola TaxID=215465 RepID=A0A9Q9ASP3_9PEZI|nr:hypothetical protein Slin15195_G072680 [Septoria linicola]